MYRGWPTRLMESTGRNKRAAGELTPRRYPCPYGVKGDLLWVRETWMGIKAYGNPATIIYRADFKRTMLLDKDHRAAGIRWRPSIHLRKRDARLWLLVKDIRVERVQDISFDKNPWVWAVRFERIKDAPGRTEAPK